MTCRYNTKPVDEQFSRRNVAAQLECAPYSVWPNSNKETQARLRLFFAISSDYWLSLLFK